MHDKEYLMPWGDQIYPCVTISATLFHWVKEYHFSILSRLTVVSYETKKQHTQPLPCVVYSKCGRALEFVDTIAKPA